MNKKVEILAPAGSIKSLQASFKAGADAVYMGGKSFGARAYADNPDNAELLRAIDYAHMRGKKVYLTVNTLVKENEVHTLYDYLKPLYVHGLDAVIVQDLGVLNLVSRCFPEMPIHISTQMSLTTSESVDFFSKNVTRVVPARELTIKEIAELKEKTGIELEVFVHGALCYSYSGQCLLSSACGDRSGNRGRCAQPCRKPYKVSGNNSCYILSPKDICTLDKLPDLIEAGVDSFKIEGRMKSPQYACGVTEVYRNAVDLYYDLGREGYYKYIAENKYLWEEQKTRLADLFNRGGFSEGYAFSETGSGMMSLSRPNHEGVFVGKAVMRKDYAELTLMQELYPGDVLEIRNSRSTEWFSYTTPVELSKNSFIRFKATQKPIRELEGTKVNVYRLRREQLLKELSEKYIESKDCIAVSGEAVLEPGNPMRFKVETAQKNNITGKKYSVSAIGAEVNEAINAPLTEQSVYDKLVRSGESDFEFEELEVKLKGNTFVAKSALGNIRRAALELLEEEICKDFRRDESRIKRIADSDKNEKQPVKRELQVSAETFMPKINCLVTTETQFNACLSSDAVGRITIDMDAPAFGWFKANSKMLIENLKFSSKELFLRTHHIANTSNLQELSDCVEKPDWKILKGFYARSLSAANIIKEHNSCFEIIADKNLYAANCEACKWLARQGFLGFVYPSELNFSEIKELMAAFKSVDFENLKITEQSFLREFCIYGREKLMISRQCIKKSLDKCNKKSEWLEISSMEDRSFLVYTNCKECKNHIYDGVILNLCNRAEIINSIKESFGDRQKNTDNTAETQENGSEIHKGTFADVYRLEFTDEDEEKTEKLLEDLTNTVKLIGKYSVKLAGFDIDNGKKCKKSLNFGHFDSPVL